MAPLSNDDVDHQSAMPSSAAAAVRDDDVLRPTEICLCKSVEADRVPRFSGPDFPYFFSEGRHEIEFRQACTDRRCAQ